MAAKKGKKATKAMGKKDLKRTKGGILIGLNQPSLLNGIKGEIKLAPSPGSISLGTIKL